jgi:hypothetical protein
MGGKHYRFVSRRKPDDLVSGWGTITLLAIAGSVNWCEIPNGVEI